MTFVPLATIRPEDGQTVQYRLRPQDEPTPATYDHEACAWVTPDGFRQAARAHHEWSPVVVRPELAMVALTTPEPDPFEEWPADPEPEPQPALTKRGLDPLTERLLRAAIDRHPAFLEALA